MDESSTIGPTRAPDARPQTLPEAHWQAQRAAHAATACVTARWRVIAGRYTLLWERV